MDDPALVVSPSLLTRALWWLGGDTRADGECGYDRGYICICLPAERLAELEIKMMVEDNQEKHRTAYTVTCDYKHGECHGPWA